MEIIARPLPGSAGRMCELWCRLDYTSTNETLFQEDFFASVLGKLEQSFQSDQVMLAPLDHLSSRELAGDLQRQGLLLEAPRFFHGGDLPKDHLFYFRSVAIMRRDAKKNRHY